MLYNLGESTTLSYDTETKLRDQLKAALRHLEAGNQNLRIEYGDPNQLPGSFTSYVRVRYMNTFGVNQFRVCELRLGTESGGAYHPSVEAAVHWAMLLVRHYHRPNPLRERFLNPNRKQPNLEWFMFDHRDPKALPILALANAEAEIRGAENAITINL